MVGEQGTPQAATGDPNDDDALWHAFLTQGDQAIAMASYPEGPLDEEIIDKVRAVIGAWQRLLAFLTAELARDAENWTHTSGHG
jgi:hypothetical protein